MTLTDEQTTATQAVDGVAQRLADALAPLVGGDLPVRLEAWDGSAAGPVDAPVVRLRSRDAVRRLLWHPGELGAGDVPAEVLGGMHMRPVGETVALLAAGGLEVRDVHAMREHYVATVSGWLERFEAAVPRLTAMVGEEPVRVWRLYLVGGAMAFRDGRMGVDQILMVRPGAAHTLAPVRTR